MTEKEKAKELVDKAKKYAQNQTPISYDYNQKEHIKNAKLCALIAVDEILSNIKEWDFTNDNSEHHFWFWSNVKEEINKLV